MDAIAHDEIIIGLDSSDPILQLNTLQRMKKDDYEINFQHVKHLTQVIDSRFGQLKEINEQMAASLCGFGVPSDEAIPSDDIAMCPKILELALTNIRPYLKLVADNNHSEESKELVDVMAKLGANAEVMAGTQRTPVLLAYAETSGLLNQEQHARFSKERRLMRHR